MEAYLFHGDRSNTLHNTPASEGIVSHFCLHKKTVPSSTEHFTFVFQVSHELDILIVRLCETDYETIGGPVSYRFVRFSGLAVVRGTTGAKAGLM